MAEADRHPRLIRSSPRLTRDEIANQSFAQAFRGLSEASVRSFLRRVADEYEAVRSRQDELFGEIDRLEAQLAQAPTAIHDEQDLMAAVGEETARVLRSAKESADEIRRNADAKATELLREANEEAQGIRDQAEQLGVDRAREVEEGGAEMLREAQRLARELQEGAEARVAEVEAKVETEAKAQLESARRRSREMVAEAQAMRERTLNELARRREALEVQLDILRAGRDRLVDAYRVVKRTLDEATEALRVVDSRASGESRRAPVTSAALPAQHGPAHEAEPEPQEEPIETAPAASGEPGKAPGPRVGSFTLGELETPIAEREAGPRPAPPLERYRVEQPSGVRLLGSEPAGEALPEPETDDAEPDDAEPEVESVGAGDSEGHGHHESVDEIFARLRAHREELDEEGPAEGEPEPEPASASHEDSATEEPEAEARAAETGLRRRRDDGLEPLVEELVRVVKRVVRDEQNLVLEAVRRHRGVPAPDDVLPSVEEQDGAFVEATADLLNEACALGEALAREMGAAGGINGDGARRRARAGELATSLARELMDPLRGRLGSALREAAAGGDQSQVGERVRARYREWKGQRIDAACGNALSGAFARGLFDAVPDGVPLRWVTTDPSPCPDCADNALEHTPRGQNFPTGHPAPPAHAGCHCLVLPVEVPAEIEVG